MATITGKISEAGNGLDVREGDYAFCSENNTVYKVAETGTIQTRQWEANWMEVEVEYVGEPSDISDDEFEGAWSVTDIAETKLPAAVTLGKLGGATRTERKSAASRANGRKGGRPRKL